MKNILLATALATTVGCATAIMRPYVGEQQSWPTTEGSIVNVKYDLPIFNSLPPVPYDVLGELRVESLFYAQPEEHHMTALIEKAKEAGAHALVLVDGQLFFGPNYGPRSATTPALSATARPVTQVNRFLPESFRPGVSVVAIRWVHGAPPGLPAKYAHLAPTYKPTAQPVPAKPAVEPKPSKPASKPSATPPAAPKTNFSPSKPATPPTTSSPGKKPAKPDEAR